MSPEKPKDITRTETKPKEMKPKAVCDANGSKNHCPKCKRLVRDGVACDDCDQWWHYKCCNVRSKAKAAKMEYKCPGGC
eukprot:Seg8567.2 transcript_id=Seg8567.2/GoldUCD/mRNA.D3Y31 product="hypothetical protein" protein_id=Seg8567.2/GoldUCD/D3Y31